MLFIKHGLGKKIRIGDNDDIKEVYDSVEISYLLNGISMSDDIASVIIYLATKGYLRIVENDDGYKLGRDNTFYLEKLKDYDKNNAVQEIIFNGLFRESDAVYLKDIEYTFYDNYKAANDTINSNRNFKRFFFSSVDKKKRILEIILFVATIVISLHSFFILSGSFMFGLLISIVFSALVTFGICEIKDKKTKIVLIAISLVLLGLGAYTLINKLNLLYIYLGGMVMISLSVLLCTKLTDRTKDGAKCLGNVYSFKNHLLNVDSEYIK